MGKKSNKPELVPAVLMIKLETIRSNEFCDAQNKLLAQPAPGPIRWKLVTMFKAVDAEQIKLEEVRRETINPYIELDDAGERIPPEDNPNGVIFKEGQSEVFWKEWQALLDVEVDLKVPRLKQADFAKLTTLSTADLMALSDLIVE